MARHTTITLIAFSLMVVCLSAETRKEADAGNVRARIIGTWSLVSTVETMTDGSKRPYLDVGSTALDTSCIPRTVICVPRA